jgi:hypothetical protein
MDVSLRKYPYPYKAMLSICSDLDETPNKEIYFETARYLNTSENTKLGDGVGLEVGNTLYFDMPEQNFSYTNTDDNGRKNINKLIQSGHIDCLHSFGDFVDSRVKIEQYWSEIRQGERKIEVWVDHAKAPTNIDADIMQGKGAIIGASAFHYDLTIESGALPFVWKGRVTSCISQNTKRNYFSLFNIKHIKLSVMTLMREFTKGVLARLGNKKYFMHKDNKVMRKTSLHDGFEFYEFMRCNPSWGGVSCFDQAKYIHRVLTKQILDNLVNNEGCSVFYTHLGKVHSTEEPFTSHTRSAFELLSKYQNENEILTATTRRLLGYLRAQEQCEFFSKISDNVLRINLKTSLSIEELQGLTWYVGDIDTIELYLNAVEINFEYNQPDETGISSISIPWEKLHFPQLLSDQ